TQSNKVIKTLKKSTNAKSGKVQVIKNIKNLITELQSSQSGKLTGIGIGIAGQVDYKKGIVISTGNFHKDFKQVKLAEILNKEFKAPVKIDNDVKCFVKAESKFGYGRVYNNFVGLTFGTGIGGGLFMDGKIWRGKDNTAGEVGHMKISGQWIGQAPMCGCGDKYCWESVASGKAWQKLYKKTHSRKKTNEIIAHNIATGLINLSLILNPDIFILAGGLMEHKDILLLIKKEFNSRVTWSHLKNVKIVNAKLGDNAILMGSLL
ncbi:ROK family protein, partial [Patescibacteria group bacterium]|nr:ROK family protein [Patescibacteria group bacterium]